MRPFLLYLAVLFVGSAEAVCADELDNAKAAESAKTESDHWAFQPVDRPNVPDVKNSAWVRNPIDAFVLARLEKKGIAPSREADPLTLLRRVYLDLIGLPPSPEDVEQFLADQRPAAYERLVGRLLASPRYGERWGRHWLDLARYADSNGYTIDGPRSIWKYRDWVIDALNRDLPFDQFTIQQIAGDLLPDATLEQKVATGFHRNTLVNEEGGTDQEQFRVEAVVDRVSTTGSVFLGLTMGCCRCHDHKYDPLMQRDFYQLFAYFNNCDEPQIEVPTPEQTRLREELQPQVTALEKQLRARGILWLATLRRWEANLSEEERAGLPEEVRPALEVAAAERDEKASKLVADHYLTRDARHAEIAQQLAALKKRLPSIAKTLVFSRRAEPRTTHMLIRGDFLRPGDVVTPGTPAVLPVLDSSASSGDAPTRLDLARWLVDPGNPLTARVTINRVWQRYFNRGLVETENDFGTQGAPPTHPELLDWLASELVECDWSLKAMHRLIVTSSTYRQSSDARAELAEIDPFNRLLARQSRRRLEAEVIRDSALAVAGLLSDKIGGPSVFPHQPEGVMQLAQVKRPWKVSPGEDRYRRGMYTYFWRSTPNPFLKTFDAPEGVTTCTRRNRSNTPLQSLTLLNHEAFVQCAAAVAARVLDEGPADDAERLRFAFQLCLVREPSKYETLRLMELLGEERAAGGSTSARSADAPTAGTAEAADAEADRGANDREIAAWTAAARVLLNVDEFVTRE